jgi:hypothetical protein
MWKIHSQSKKEWAFKNFFRATLNWVFSFLRLVILCGKLLTILIPMWDAPFWKQDRLAIGLWRWCLFLVWMLYTDEFGEFRKAHSVLKLDYTGCTDTNIISHWPWLYLFKTPQLNVENNFLFTFNSSVFLDFKVFSSLEDSYQNICIHLSFQHRNMSRPFHFTKFQCCDLIPNLSID